MQISEICGSRIFSHETGQLSSLRAAVSVLVGPCCPALLNSIDVDVYTVVLLGQWRRQRGEGGTFPPPWVDVQKLCNMCVMNVGLLKDR